MQRPFSVSKWNELHLNRCLPHRLSILIPKALYFQRQPRGLQEALDAGMLHSYLWWKYKQCVYMLTLADTHTLYLLKIYVPGPTCQ